jgi:hypothetical protein
LLIRKYCLVLEEISAQVELYWLKVRKSQIKLKDVEIFSDFALKSYVEINNV